MLVIFHSPSTALRDSGASVPTEDLFQDPQQMPNYVNHQISLGLGAEMCSAAIPHLGATSPPPQRLCVASQHWKPLRHDWVALLVASRRSSEALQPWAEHLWIYEPVCAEPMSKEGTHFTVAKFDAS